MATKTTKKTKKSPSSAKKSAPARKIEAPKYKSFRVSKRIRHPGAKLPGSFKLLRASISHLWQYKKLFLGITAVYALLQIVFVRGFAAGGDIPGLQEDLREVLTGGTGRLVTGVTLFGVLVSSAGSAPSEVASVYQSVILVIISLAVIWALRQTHAKERVGVKESFYKSTHPLVPFVLVLLVIGLQLLPFAAGSALYSAVVTGGLAVTALEQFLWAAVFFLLALLSFYMVSSSVFVFYIVTLPDMRPMQALRSARELVRYRRWTVLRKVIFLPIALLIIGAVILVPVILVVAVLAEWVFLLLSLLALIVAHSYVYSLYRELL